MKKLVVHLTNINNTMIASARIAKYLATLLKCELKCAANGRVDKYDVIYLVNGPPAFCNWREELAAMVRKCGTLVFVQNDYTISPPSQVNKVLGERGWRDEKGHYKPPHIWTTVESKLRDEEADALVNWNCLTYTGLTPTIRRTSAGKFIYYGSFRNGREEYFKKYFSNWNRKQALYISCPPRAVEKFTAITGTAAHFVDKFLDLEDSLMDYQYTIYMEDVYSHKNYCHPANRFYECLSAGVIQFVDKNAAATLMRAGYHTGDVQVESMKDVEYCIKHHPAWVDILCRWADTAKLERKKLDKRVRSLDKELERTYG